VRCYAAKLLHTLSEVQDGVLTFVGQMCIELFINGQLEGTDPSGLFKIWHINITHDDIIKTSLVVIAILSDQIAQRNDLLAKLDILFSINITKLL
jgi:hypothetical protein